LLGSSRVPKVDSAMGSKSAALNKAYAFAVKQHQVMRTENISEQDALERVVESLQQEEKEERHVSRAVAQEMEEKRSKVPDTVNEPTQAAQQLSDQFWQSIRDETAAEVFLQRLLDAGPPEDATEQQAAFWELGYEEQLEKLVNLGAIREM
jgi:ABC-type uncharacterized transport system involved in gliding motility auxiliary subunit